MPAQAESYLAVYKTLTTATGRKQHTLVVRPVGELEELLNHCTLGSTLHQLTAEMVSSAEVALCAVRSQLERGEFEQL